MFYINKMTRFLAKKKLDNNIIKFEQNVKKK